MKDVAAHLLDTQLRQLSFGRDGYGLSPPPVITSDRALVRSSIRISGNCGGDWDLYRDLDAWTLTDAPIGTRVAVVDIPQEIAWRIFTKGITREEARTRVTISGDSTLGEHVLSMLAIVG